MKYIRHNSNNNNNNNNNNNKNDRETSTKYHLLRRNLIQMLLQKQFQICKTGDKWTFDWSKY